VALAGLLDLSDVAETRLVRGMQLGLVAIGGYGLVVGEFGAVAPAAVGLGLTFVPAVLRREYGYSMDGGLVLWITVAVFLHAVGSLGLYSQYQWYDEITHTVSATLVAALGYASFRALELHTDEIDVPGTFRSVFIVVFVLAAAVAWEVLEFALDGYFTVYGIDDIVTDMIANVVGAVVVAIGGVGPVDGLVEFLRGRIRSEEG
jgi:hypothetical protein